MTDEDQFELELAALRPRGPSTELRRRIAEGLATTITPTRSVSEELDFTYPQSASLTRRVSMVGGLLAASLVAVVVWRDSGQSIETQTIPALEANVETAFDESSPSWWSYRNGLTNSTYTLDQLLDKYAVQSFEHKSRGAPDLLAARFNSDMDSLLGEL